MYQRRRETKSRAETEKREKEEEKKQTEELERRLAELERQLHPPAITTLSLLRTALTDNTKIEIRVNTIIHTGPPSSQSCTFTDELKTV